MTMKRNNEFPSREELDQAFHFLHDQINWISVVEEVEMQKKENDLLQTRKEILAIELSFKKNFQNLPRFYEEYQDEKTIYKIPDTKR